MTYPRDASAEIVYAEKKYNQKASESGRWFWGVTVDAANYAYREGKKLAAEGREAPPVNMEFSELLDEFEKRAGKPLTAETYPYCKEILDSFNLALLQGWEAGLKHPVKTAAGGMTK